MQYQTLTHTTLRRCAAVATAICAAAPALAAPLAPRDVTPHSAVAAPRWTAMFDRRDGWTGADGVYTIPLSGSEKSGNAAANGRTLILFSDSFVGTVNADLSRSDTTMVNNTTALLDGNLPDPAKLQFNVRRGSNGKARSMVIPKNPDDPSERFWFSDGVVIDGTVYAFTMRIKDADTPPFAFATAGITLVAAKASDPVPFAGPYTQRRTPLYIPPADGVRETYYGGALMALTEAAGAPRPDGYLYVYGARSGPYTKGLVVARVPPQQIADFAAYRYWDGSAWNEDIHSAMVITGQVSAEFSVHPLPDGRYMLVHQTDLLGTQVAVRYGQSPTGPWGKDIIVWDCPEATLTANTFVYGAKAHPHLSTQRELLISYHVNTFDFWENFTAGGAAIYRPRFIKVPLP